MAEKLRYPTTPDTHRGSEKDHNDALWDELYRIAIGLAMLIAVIFTTKSK